MKEIALIFPHQLFENHPVLEYTKEVYLVEDSLFFGDSRYPMNFHKQKIIFHRASMKCYQQKLEGMGIRVSYIEYKKGVSLENILKETEDNKVWVVDPTDFILEKRLRKKYSHINFLESPLFINSKKDNQEYLEKNSLFMKPFYTYQRKRLNILMEGTSPKGGRFSFDDENRKKIPSSEFQKIPPDSEPNTNAFIDEAKAYVEKHFSENYGSGEDFSYQINHKEAQRELEIFCQERFHLFGNYEDAIVRERSRLYHSILSPYLNVGLLNPKDVVHYLLDYADSHDISINNTEGIIRQIIGWREFMRMSYEKKGVSMRSSNQWKHQSKLSKAWYQGTTGLDPVDNTIKKTIKYAYTHHIERLMIMGNIFFLCEINPQEVYQWFMELYIDAYDWVMVPNVYAMAQNTQGGVITTKPYISGSNYIKNMSNYPKGPWSDIWDALYWYTIISNIEVFKKNGRMHFVTARAEKLSKEQREHYETIATNFYQSLS